MCVARENDYCFCSSSCCCLFLVHYISLPLPLPLKATLRANNDVVDGNVYQLNEESNESHDAEANGSGNSDLLELLAVGLGAALDQADGVLGEEASRFSEFNNFVHGGLANVGEEGTLFMIFIYF